jgi:murein DD-endopeptidase MepM/ murein hydrolase activator NlpD
MTTAPLARRPRRPVGWAILGGYVLGAATVLVIVWFAGFAPGTGPSATTSALRPVPHLSPPPAAPLASNRASGPPVVTPALAEPATSLAPRTPPTESPATDALLGDRHLLLPVAGVATSALTDSYRDARGGGRVHEALDIMAPRNTPVLAADDGKVAKLFYSVRGGNTIYEFDPSETFSYYYAHLDRYADGLHEGDPIHRGQLIGYVGSTGDADASAPHLHFAIFQLDAEKRWWKGSPINPFTIFHPS